MSSPDPGQSNWPMSQHNLWTTVKDLSGLVESAIMHKTPGIRPDLEAELNANKSLFAQLLKNPPRSDADATLLRKATTEGIKMPGMDVSKKIGRLPAQVVDEALIVSEMFGLNEMVSLQLVLSGEERLCDYPGLTRGLIAILLYYDGRKTLIDTLKTMILGRQGCTWTLEATPDVAVFITNFTEDSSMKDLCKIY